MPLRIILIYQHALGFCSTGVWLVWLMEQLSQMQQAKFINCRSSTLLHFFHVHPASITHTTNHCAYTIMNSNITNLNTKQFTTKWANYSKPLLTYVQHLHLSAALSCWSISGFRELETDRKAVCQCCLEVESCELKPTAELWSVTCHMGTHGVTWHPT